MDFDVLEAGSDIILEGEVFRHSYTHQTDDDTTAHAYDGDDFGSALFIYSEAEGYPALDGYILLHGQEYTVNNCGDQCSNGHILVKLTEGKYEEHGEMLMEEEGISMNVSTKNAVFYHCQMHFMLQVSDRITQLSLAEDRWASNGKQGLSMMAYYTPEFEQEFGGQSGAVREIQLLIEENNKAFEDSGINVQLHAFCFEKLDISDNENDDARQRLDAFDNAKGSVHALLQSYDIAVLMTKNGVST